MPPSDDSVNAIPQTQSPVTEQQLHNLPDCVPLEIKSECIFILCIAAHAQWSSVCWLKHTVNYCANSYLFPSTHLSLLPSFPPCAVPELIYTVLDLVPVQQVKQLVRTLGVTDTEIEQAQMDHKSCRESHYQMLRMWAERGSQAGGRGRGGILHWSLMQDLLDKLRKMHLGRAAEELETIYGIQ